MALALASDSSKRGISKESRNDQQTRLVDHLKLLEQKIKGTQLYLAQVVYLLQGQQT